MNVTFLIVAIVLVNIVHSRFTEVPPPPKRPDRFATRDEVRRYLQKLHEYHLIVGKWRMRREKDENESGSLSDEDLFHAFDLNDDQKITFDEFTQQLDSSSANLLD